MKIDLPDSQGKLYSYQFSGKKIVASHLSENPARVILSAAHVVADPCATRDPANTAVDWAATLDYRRYLDSLGLGIAEAMDTAQRGMGLGWQDALELIRQTTTELPDALVFNGVGTDHLDLAQTTRIEQVRAAYLEQIEAVQKLDARIILMASRALAKVAQTSDDYQTIYADLLAHCDQPVILHWLGDMFDPQLGGYWGGGSFDQDMQCLLAIIQTNRDKVDGIKMSLLDKDKEITMRRLLPSGVRMYTGDDFNYPELIEGDEQGYSHALLGIFDPLAEAAAAALTRLSDGDSAGFRQILDPTVELAREIFTAPTWCYKTGVVFLAWLNGFQNHFVMLAGAQSQRSLSHLVRVFTLADGCGLLRNPELARERMRQLLKLHGTG